ncbi:DNA polymerase III subunit delta' [Anaerosporobacter faecicola]|uniref:DNA polymerase III subunit delta' n=1 Tax=Anaerosporobacter faecicola TaxID=2718714 RepID=UPI00143A75C0|nr:DNA polymerase III subunit delta' [Anaerosporobacter faecicola]
MYDFDSIVGHEQIIEHLQNAIKLGKVSHAYIINGEKGMGKKTIAYSFAKTLQCEEHATSACNSCKSCLQLESGNHPDVIMVTHEKASIGVDDIRVQLNSDIAIKPYSSPYKIYIVDDADKMTEQAQNALLKTIEEPPAYAVILLLTTNSSKLLPTILSRCVTLNLKPVSSDAIKEHLMEQYSIPDYMAEMSATFSQGILGRAIRYASSEEFTQSKEEVLHLLKYIDDMELYEIMESIKNLASHKLEINDYLDLMILWYRDILMFKVTKNPNLLLFKEEYKYISEQASKKDYEGIENIINAMNKAKVRLNANVNFETVMELMLLTLKEN